MYKFLVTNDDGIESIGLIRLIQALSELGTVYAVAPAEQQSAKSMALTFSVPVHATEADVEGAEVAYVVNGTPVDCVKWAVDRFRGVIDFDYIISGINLGSNLGTDHFYSGTVAAAREGAIQGIHSIALSVKDHHAEHFDYICSMLPELLEMSSRLDTHTLLNVNTPNLPDWKVKGVRLITGAPYDYGDCYHYTMQDDGSYQMGASFSEVDDSLENDFNAIMDGYATITPITAYVDDRVALRRLQGFSVEEPICIFLDAQEDIAAGVKKGGRWERNITRWARCIDRLDMPALIAEQHGMGPTVDGVINSIDRAEIIERTVFNAMDSDSFTTLLSAGTSKRIYIAGLETHIAIQMTAIDLLKRDYEVVVIEDCCASGTVEDHAVAIDNLRSAGAAIMTYEAAIMEILGGTSHQAYRSICEIIHAE